MDILIDLTLDSSKVEKIFDERIESFAAIICGLEKRFLFFFENLSSFPFLTLIYIQLDYQKKNTK